MTVGAVYLPSRNKRKRAQRLRVTAGTLTVPILTRLMGNFRRY